MAHFYSLLPLAFALFALALRAVSLVEGIKPLVVWLPGSAVAFCEETRTAGYPPEPRIRNVAAAQQAESSIKVLMRTVGELEENSASNLQLQH